MSLSATMTSGTVQSIHTNDLNDTVFSLGKITNSSTQQQCAVNLRLQRFAFTLILHLGWMNYTNVPQIHKIKAESFDSFVTSRTPKHSVQVLKALHILMDIKEDTILQSWASLWGVYSYVSRVLVDSPTPPPNETLKKLRRGGLGEAGCAVTPWKAPPMLLYMDRFSCRPSPCTQDCRPVLIPWRHSKRIPFKSLGTNEVKSPSSLSFLFVQTFWQVQTISCLARRYGWIVVKHLM